MQQPAVMEEIDEGNGERVVVHRVPKGKPISREEVLDLQYRAYVQEGQVLSYRSEFHRAIDVFTKAININKEALGILVDRANCYIQVGDPRAALLDINAVLHVKPEDTRAMLAKAEAFFSMGEFEFALVFFERGYAIRTDVIGFRDGITKSKSAIRDSINGEKPFQPNPNFAASRPRKPLIPLKKITPLEPEDQEEQEIVTLLPENVLPLTLTVEQKGAYLGELALDYDYLVELREEILAGTDDETGRDEDQKILELVNHAIIYLNHRAQFWCQQEAAHPPKESQESFGLEDSPDVNRREPQSARRVMKVRKTPAEGNRTASGSRATGRRETPTPHYEMTNIQIYEEKYGAKPEVKRR
jgi:tetratricopeptide (TPR) repeat protein